MKEGHFFDKPQNLKRLLMGFYIFLGLLIIVEFFIPKHPFFPWEGYPSFYGVYGFVSYTIIVFGSNYILRKLLKRKEDYYD
ncbi:MAG TPA: hypothetical protein DD641_08910 [Deltaproteobacteria bacterium]|nr:hypothetical protein [Deltaproteobacteria bacterium]